MRELSGAERRQIIDGEQVFDAWRATSRELAERFSGSMSWKTVSGKRYLYRKTSGTWKSLGVETPQTTETFDRFHNGRAALKARLASLDAEIVKNAKVLRAMDLGRVPLTSARVLRALDKVGALGSGIMVVGTNALYAYERIAGIQFGSDIAATMDIDLLYDVRGQLDLMASGLGESGLIGVLQQVDPSFEPVGKGSFRAADNKGFMVDLITPSVKNAATRQFRQSMSGKPDDLVAAEIEGLGWMESSPSIDVVAIDERGFPLRIVAPDPRAFVCHKLWVADQPNRDPFKRQRDRAQALAVCEMLVTHRPDLPFEDHALSALPLELRQRGQQLALTVQDSVGPATDDGWR